MIAKSAIAVFVLSASVSAAVSWFAVPRAAVPGRLDFAQSVIPVGKGPGFTAIADVNHDGRPDLVVANTDGASVSVLLGDGKGSFTPAPGSPFACNPNPNDIAVADMTGSGNLDLVIANHQTPYITVLLGDGRGGFRPSPHSPFTMPTHPHPHGVVVGDFFGDGKPAVVTDSWGSDQILLLPTDGKGNLLLPGTFFATNGHSDQGVRAARFTKSGKLDIVTTAQNLNAISVLLGDGKGGFRKAPGSPFPAGAAAWAFTVDDVNGDGNPDVVVIPYHREVRDPKQLGVTVLLGDGRGGFSTMRGSPLSLDGCDGPDRVATGDIRGNGLRDIVVSCALNDKLFLFMAAKDGSFSLATQSVPTGWGGVAVGRIDGSGKDSVIVSNNRSGTVTILRSK